MATSTKTTPVARKAATTAAPKRSPRKTSAVKKAATPKRPAPKAAAPGKTAQALVNKPVKLEKVKKPKMIRDSFTIPKPEYLVLDVLKERAGKLARAAKKSELLRAGIKALAAMPDAAFLAALAAVPTIKTGRPAATA
ncbi:MAG: hypothetical protein KAY33_04910 [Polaromonas sp.]|jgi:hypothetical protein|nr:hypothetical protein [Polaromonas sp.]